MVKRAVPFLVVGVIALCTSRYWLASFPKRNLVYKENKFYGLNAESLKLYRSKVTRTTRDVSGRKDLNHESFNQLRSASALNNFGKNSNVYAISSASDHHSNKRDVEIGKDKKSIAESIKTSGLCGINLFKKGLNFSDLLLQTYSTEKINAELRFIILNNCTLRYDSFLKWDLSGFVNLTSLSLVNSCIKASCFIDLLSSLPSKLLLLDISGVYLIECPQVVKIDLSRIEAPVEFKHEGFTAEDCHVTIVVGDSSFESYEEPATA